MNKKARHFLFGLLIILFAVILITILNSKNAEAGSCVCSKSAKCDYGGTVDPPVSCPYCGDAFCNDYDYCKPCPNYHGKLPAGCSGGGGGGGGGGSRKRCGDGKVNRAPEECDGNTNPCGLYAKSCSSCVCKYHVGDIVSEVSTPCVGEDQSSRQFTLSGTNSYCGNLTVTLPWGDQIIIDENIYGEHTFSEIIDIPTSFNLPPASPLDIQIVGNRNELKDSKDGTDYVSACTKTVTLDLTYDTFYYCPNFNYDYTDFDYYPREMPPGTSSGYYDFYDNDDELVWEDCVSDETKTACAPNPTDCVNQDQILGSGGVSQDIEILDTNSDKARDESSPYEHTVSMVIPTDTDLVLCLGGHNPSDSISSVKYDGNDMTEIVKAARPTDTYTMAHAYYYVPSSSDWGQSKSCTIKYSSVSSSYKSNGAIAILALKGVDTNNPIGDTASGAGRTSSRSQTIDTAVDNSLVLAATYMAGWNGCAPDPYQQCSGSGGTACGCDATSYPMNWAEGTEMLEHQTEYGWGTFSVAKKEDQTGSITMTSNWGSTTRSNSMITFTINPEQRGSSGTYESMPSGTVFDVDGDGEHEICHSEDGIQGGWLDADSLEEKCDLVDGIPGPAEWFDCTLYTGECDFGVDDFDGLDSTGLCCGDDDGEIPVHTDVTDGTNVYTLQGNFEACCQESTTPTCVDKTGYCRSEGYSQCFGDNTKITCTADGEWLISTDENCLSDCAVCDTNGDGEVTQGELSELEDCRDGVLQVCQCITDGDDTDCATDDWKKYDKNKDGVVDAADIDFCAPHLGDCNYCDDGILEPDEQCSVDSSDNIEFTNSLCPAEKCVDKKTWTRDETRCINCFCVYEKSCEAGKCGATCTDSNDCLNTQVCHPNECGCVDYIPGEEYSVHIYETDCTYKFCVSGDADNADGNTTQGSITTSTEFISHQKQYFESGDILTLNNDGNKLVFDVDVKTGEDCILFETDGEITYDFTMDDNDAILDLIYFEPSSTHPIEMPFIYSTPQSNDCRYCEPTEEYEYTLDDGIDNDCDGLIDEPHFEEGYGVYIWDANCDYFLCAYTDESDKHNTTGDMSIDIDNYVFYDVKSRFWENSDTYELSEDEKNILFESLIKSDLDCLLYGGDTLINYDLLLDSEHSTEGVYLTQSKFHPFTNPFNFAAPECTTSCLAPDECGNPSVAYGTMDCSYDACMFDCGGYWVNESPTTGDLLWPDRNAGDSCEDCFEDINCTEYNNAVACQYDPCGAASSIFGCAWDEENYECYDPFELCPPRTTLCQDGICRQDCDDTGKQGCIGPENGICEPGEGCACDDCEGEQDSCTDGAECGDDDYCGCPIGTTLCEDMTCDEDCDDTDKIGCDGPANGVCEFGEGCDCADCEFELDSCVSGAICNYFDEICVDEDVDLCPEGETLCYDLTCDDDCTGHGGKIGCIGQPDDYCAELEGCACEDCNGEQDHCAPGLICNFDKEECVDDDGSSGGGGSTDTGIEYCTQTQGGWGSTCSGQNTGCLRDDNWEDVVEGSLVVGVGDTITLTTSSAVENYLPAVGTPSTLEYDVTDPTDTESGILGGQVTALKLNVLFAEEGIGKIGDADNIGNLYIASGIFKGKTVYEFLYIAEKVLGGSLLDYTPTQVNDVAALINENYVDCEIDKGFLLKVKPSVSDFDISLNVEDNVRVLDLFEVKVTITNNLDTPANDITLSLDVPSKFRIRQSTKTVDLRAKETREIIFEGLVEDYDKTSATLLLEASSDDGIYETEELDVEVYYPDFLITVEPLFDYSGVECLNYYYIVNKNNLPKEVDLEFGIENPSSIFGKSVAVDYISEIKTSGGKIVEPMISNPYCLPPGTYEIKGYLYSPGTVFVETIDESTETIIIN